MGIESDHASKDGMKLKYTKTSSLLEKCSFACHLFLFPIGLLYLLWLVAPVELLETVDATYYPKKDYALLIPVTTLLLFLAAPMLYGAFNFSIVPDINSLNTIEDVYTKPPSRTKLLSNEMLSPDSTLPEICDMDPSILVWDARDEN
jgi:hypothetical protein